MPTRLSKARRLIAEDKATEPLDVLSAPDLAERKDFATVSLRAEALHASRHFGEAEAMYQRAVESRPDFAFSYYGLSLAQLALERPDASASFSRVLMLRAGPAWYSRLLDSAHRGSIVSRLPRRPTMSRNPDGLTREARTRCTSRR